MRYEKHPDDLIETADAAKILRVTPDAVRKLVRRKCLIPAAVTPRGGALHRRSDVERFRDDRRRKSSTAA